MRAARALGQSVSRWTRREADRGWRLWCAFWFESQSPARLKLFRVSYGWFMVVLQLVRAPDLEIYFSERGILPLSRVNDLLPMEGRYSLLYLTKSTAALWGAEVAFIASLALLALGIWPRVMALAAFVLHVSFMHRNMSPMYGVDMISCFYLLYLALAVYRPAETRGEPSVATQLSSVAFRLMQIQICIIYAYAGLDKARGGQWWGGEALWGVVSNPQLARWDFTWFSHFPLVLVFMTYSTLLWEIYFPALVWVKPLRNFMLLFGVALHVGIALVVNIAFFGVLMMLLYLLLIEEELAARWLKKIKPVFLPRID